MKTIHGEASHILDTPELSLAVTGRAGHLAPVVFHLDGRDVSPYSLSPWEPGPYPDQPPLLSVLRGDFLCLPFGGQESGPPHGDPANAEWTLASMNDRELVMRLKCSDSGADIEKRVSVREGEHAVRVEHRISNLDGAYSYGTHPIIDMSSLAEGAARISVSPFHWASTFPGKFSDPANGETQCLAESAEFADLTIVPLADGGTTDLTRYPARPGNDDLVMMAAVPATEEQPFAWSAAVLDGYVWFSIKDPVTFPCTLFWISWNGRSAAPWESRHDKRIGIEEVCSYYSHGVVESRKNPLADKGIPTVREFRPDQTVSLKMLQAVAAVPDDFGMVVAIRPIDDATVSIEGENGAIVKIPLDWRFVL